MARATIQTGELISDPLSFHKGRVAPWRRKQRDAKKSGPRMVMNTTSRFQHIPAGGSAIIEFDQAWKDVSVHVHGGQAAVLDATKTARWFGPVAGTRTEKYLQLKGTAPMRMRVHAGDKPVRIGLCYLVYHDPTKQAYGARASSGSPRSSTFRAKQGALAEQRRAAVEAQGLREMRWRQH